MEMANDTKKKDQSDLLDKDLVSMMGFRLLNNGGLQTLKTAIEQSADPGQVAGQFLAMMTGQLAEYSRNEFGVDPGIFAQPGSFLDQQIDYVKRKLNLDDKFADQLYGETLEVMKAAAKSGTKVPTQGMPQQPQSNRPLGLDGGI